MRNIHTIQIHFPLPKASGVIPRDSQHTFPPLCWTVLTSYLVLCELFLAFTLLVFGDLTSLSSLATSFKSPRTNSKSSTIILICSFTLALEACPSVGEDVPLDFADMLQSSSRELQKRVTGCSPLWVAVPPHFLAQISLILLFFLSLYTLCHELHTTAQWMGCRLVAIVEQCLRHRALLNQGRKKCEIPKFTYDIGLLYFRAI